MAIVAFTAARFARVAYLAVVAGVVVQLLVAREYGAVSHGSFA